MNQELNPYKPTAAMLEEPPSPEATNGYWRDGKLLVTFSESDLPPRCVKCNEPVQASGKLRKVYWHAPWLYVLVFISVPIYVIVALIVRKTAKIPMTLCRRHVVRRRWFIAFGWVGFFACIFAGLVLSDDKSTGGLVGFLLGLICAVIGISSSRTLWPAKIELPFVRLKGCGEAYLAELPEFSDRRYAKMREWSR